MTRDSRLAESVKERDFSNDGYVRVLVVVVLLGAKGDASVRRLSWRSLRV